ncbi:MAG: hypothetical protein KY437_09335 [Actinobacteria bacterium]|nr:hypothetical protein [Actinomycetota bacterium]
MDGQRDDVRAAPGDPAIMVDDYFRLQVLAFGHIAPHGRSLASDNGVFAHVGVPSVFNRATALDLRQPDVSLSEVERFFGDLPHALWLRSDNVDEDADALLRTRGYLPLRPIAGMIRSLPADDLPERDDHRTTLLADPGLAAQVAEVASSGFGFGVEDRLIVEDLARHVLRHAKPFDHGAIYGVVDDDRSGLIAVGFLLCTADVAGLSTFATTIMHRHRGLATAIATRAMHDAAAFGYPYAATVANPDSTSLFNELGYRPVTEYRVYRQVSP